MQQVKSRVMGLPLFETALLLAEAGVPIGPFGRVGD
jgi:predicted house-cleaning NTP pyrophosphatase (Maf/HAM1 superfamily)